MFESMSLKLKINTEKVQKNKKKTIKYYEEYFRKEIKSLIEMNLSEEKYIASYAILIISMWDEFIDGYAPVSPTQSDVCITCPSMVLVSGILNNHIKETLGDD